MAPVGAVDGGVDVTVRWSGPPGTEIRLTATGGITSLATWLALNVDPAARGTGGLAIFTEPQAPLNSQAWREDLLVMARKWNATASRLVGKASLASHPAGWLDVADPESTMYYLEWTAQLLRFAEIIYLTGAPVGVS